MLVLSPASVISDNVRKELDIAEEASKPVLPIIIGQVTIPRSFAYHLAGLQRIDMASSFDTGASKLLHALRQLVPNSANDVPTSMLVDNRASSTSPPDAPVKRLVSSLMSQAAAAAEAWTRPSKAASDSIRFENVFRRGASLMIVLGRAGELTISEDRIAFTRAGVNAEIEFSQVRSVTEGRLAGDLINQWCIVRYGDPEELVGFIEGGVLGWRATVLGWRGDSALFHSLQAAFHRFNESHR